MTAITQTAIHRRVKMCRDGCDQTLIARMPSGWAVMGDPQVLRGYCLLLPDPVVPHLNALQEHQQSRFMSDLAHLGQAVFDLTGAIRINYALFGNVEPALHGHVLPRFSDEPEEMRAANPWGYEWSCARAFDSTADGELLRALRARLLNRETGP